MESGRTGTTARAGWVRRLLRKTQPGGKPRQNETYAGRASRRTSQAAVRVEPPRDALLRRQFAEAFYLMVMASGMRDRARALGRRYGVAAVEMRAEILEYLDRLISEVPVQSETASPVLCEASERGGDQTA
jgi:hypothetical protein